MLLQGMPVERKSNPDGVLCLLLIRLKSRVGKVVELTLKARGTAQNLLVLAPLMSLVFVVVFRCVLVSWVWDT